MYAVYDLQDNLITVFDDLTELADYFDTSYNCMKSLVCKQRKGKLKKKRDKHLKKWCLIKKIEIGE
jgi:uncharacterized protein YggL (DUF469 family)